MPTKRKGSTQLELLKFIFIHFIKGKRKLTPFLPACKEEWVLLLRHHGRILYSPSFSAFVGSTCHVNSTKIKSSHEIMLEVTTLAAQWFLNHHDDDLEKWGKFYPVIRPPSEKCSINY